jgi:hypothetical protein
MADVLRSTRPTAALSFSRIMQLSHHSRHLHDRLLFQVMEAMAATMPSTSTGDKPSTPIFAFQSWPTSLYKPTRQSL